MVRLRMLPGLVARAVRLCWAANPGALLLAAGLQVVAGVGIGVQLLVGQRVLRMIIGAEREGAGFSSVVPGLVTLGVVALATGVAVALQSGRQRLLVEHTIRHVNREILEVAGAVDLVTFEDHEFFDSLERAERQSMSSLQISMSLLTLCNTLVTSIGLVIALLGIQPLLVPLVLLGYLPLWLTAARNAGSMYSFSFGATPDDRARFALSTILTRRESAAEVRAFDLPGFLRERWEGLYRVRLNGIEQMVRRNDRRSLAASVASAALTAGTLGVMGALFLAGRIDVAAAATGAVAIQQLGSRLAESAGSLSGLYENALFLSDLDAFLERRPARADTPRADPIGFDRLSVELLGFSYPGASHRALDAVDLEIRAGEVIALVGENGSGKTTLAKLLAGLYHPTEGRIAWDGVEVRELGLDRVRRSVAVIFQDFQRYPFSLRDNIGLGDPDHVDDLDRVRSAAEAAGVDAIVEGLEEGWDTLLG
ncbi:MAG TPA: ABC transporter ATP-binding protein, partial [Actinomycetota bacterium]|nr:ABC transporter ATP-binding protein [Actinomycetota bacterium]